jgi:hypothetical protein
VQSHFNAATALDARLFTIMGLFILVVWAMNLAAGALVLRQRLGSPPFAWGIRLGLLVSAAAMLAAVPMLMVGGHTVGAPDGGPGLPIVGWSSVAGDLRIGHGLGLHGMQVLPLVGWLLSRLGRPRLGDGHRAALVAVVGLLYLGLVGLLTWQALRAQPLLSPDVATLAALVALVAAATLAVAAVSLHARAASGRATAAAPA